MKKRQKLLTDEQWADKGYDFHDFVGELRNMNITPHVAQNDTSSAIDRRTTRHDGYRVSQRKRKRIEEVFGWMKTVGVVTQATASRTGAGWLGVHLHGSGLQSGAHPQSHARYPDAAVWLNPPAEHPHPSLPPGRTRKSHPESTAEAAYKAYLTFSAAC